MTKVSHTPGPWSDGNEALLTKANERHPWNGTVFVDGEQVVALSFAAEPEEAAANARLIAAAPDMLEALKQAERKLVAVYGEPDGSSLESKAGADAIRTVRAAIAKGEGRS